MNRSYGVIKVQRCDQCPFYTTVGMEHMMLCEHPYWDDKEPYAGAIITHENRRTIPEKCPLRKGDLIIPTKIVSLA